MSEQDRLAALLERATRERRGDDDPSADGAGAENGAADGSESWAEVEDTPEGGAWLPPDPGRHRPVRPGPRVLTLPESLRSVNLGVRPIAVVALVVVALVAAGVFGLRWWRAEQDSTPVPVAPLAADAGTLTGEGAGAVAGDPTSDQSSTDQSTSGDAPKPSGTDGVATTGAAPQPAELVVHVAGQVQRPGVVTVPAGARVAEAVDAAGGLGPDADTSRVNLARAVVDGERIWVPAPGEEVPEIAEGPEPPPASAEPGPGGGPPGEGGGQQININTADPAVLEELPGVGPVTAAAIVAWRTENGQFSNPDELLEVSGIGEATLEKLRPHVTL